MKVTIGAESARPVRKSTLAAATTLAAVASSLASSTPGLVASVGQDARRLRMAQMARSAGVPVPALRSSVAGPVGPTQGGCDPGGCEEPIDPRVLHSIMQSQQGTAMTNPPGSGLSDQQWAAVVGIVNATKYCPSPRRVGWQQSSLTFQALAVPNGNTVTINLTPGQAFCMNALVAANSSANDVRFTIDSLTYLGVEYVTNGPWFSLFYTAQAACCLCVRELPIIDPNTTVTMVATNENGAAAALRVQIFGDELFC